MCRPHQMVKMPLVLLRPSHRAGGLSWSFRVLWMNRSTASRLLEIRLLQSRRQNLSCQNHHCLGPNWLVRHSYSRLSFVSLDFYFWCIGLLQTNFHCGFSFVCTMLFIVFELRYEILIAFSHYAESCPQVACIALLIVVWHIVFGYSFYILSILIAKLYLVTQMKCAHVRTFDIYFPIFACNCDVFQARKRSDHIARWCCLTWPTKTIRRCFWNTNGENWRIQWVQLLVFVSRC